MSIERTWYTTQEAAAELGIAPSTIRWAKRAGLLRNVALAMGNSGDRRFLPVLQELCQDEDAIVAEHARWAVGKIVDSG